MNAQTVTLNTEQRLYVIPCGKGFTCHGFDVVSELTRKLEDWLSAYGKPWDVPHMAVLVGTIEAYENYQHLLTIAQEYCAANSIRCDIELTPQLIGLEGNRVEVVDADGDKRRFIVGRSNGWMPCHLEIASRRSHGGPSVYGAPFKSVRVVR